MRVLITGGTGLIGRELVHKLKAKGYEVAVLSRTKSSNGEFRTFAWDPGRNEIEEEAIQTADYIVHLAGANISGKRWSERRKRVIIDSRVESAKLLFAKVKSLDVKLKAFISASGINYYGVTTSEKIFTEKDPPAGDFLGETCRQWEQTANRFKQLRIRTVIIRNGVALSRKGGALPKMAVPVNLGVGAPVGSGRQYFPWIHIDDLCNIYIKAIEDPKMRGPYNGVAPEHVTNKDLMKALAWVNNKPFWAPKAPAGIMKVALGEMADLLLEGSRISSEKIRSAGYEYLFPDLEGALADLYSKS